MDENIKVIAMLMVKYAQHEALTDEERRMLEEWWEAAPENRVLAERVADEDWLERALVKLDQVPRRKMWREINRQLDEIDGVAEDVNLPARGTEGWVLQFSFAAAALILVVWTGWLWWGRVGNWPAAGVEDKTVSSAPVVPASLAPPDKGDVSGDARPRSDLLASVPASEIGSGDGTKVYLTMETSTVASDADVEEVRKASTPGRAPVTEGLLMRGPVRAGAGGLIHNCVAVATNPTAYVKQTSDRIATSDGSGYGEAGQDTADSYALAGRTLRRIVGDTDRPVEIHLPNGKRIRVKKDRFVVEAEADPPMSKVAIYSGRLRPFNNEDSSRPPAADTPATRATAASSHPFRFNHSEFERVLAEVAGRYGLRISNPEKWKGTAITGEVPQLAQPEGVIQLLQLLENGFVQIRLEQNVIVVSGWPGNK